MANKYVVKTKIENGLEKIDARPNPTDKRKLVYLVMDEKGNTKEVDKKWLVEHIDNIVNLGLSGNSLYLKGKSLIKGSMSFFNSEVHSLIDQELPILFKKNGFSDVVIEHADYDKSDLPSLTRYKISIENKNKAYKFDKGYLCLQCYIKYENNSLVLYLSLINEADTIIKGLYHSYMGKENLKTIVDSQSTNLKKGVKLVNPESYGIPCYSGVRPYNKSSTIYSNYKEAFENKYPGNVHAFQYDRIHFHFIDDSDAVICMKNLIKVLNAFIKENKEIIESYLYASKAKPKIPYTLVAKAEGFCLPSGKSSVRKAIELEKKGYKIVVNDRVMSAEDFSLKCKKDTENLSSNPFSCVTYFYDSVSEYIDKKNKVFYCQLGPIRSENMYC